MMYLPKTAALTIGVTALAVALVGGIQPATAGTANTGPPRVTAAQPAIPDAALLQPQDLGGVAPSEVTDDYWDALRPPQPCADRPYRSTALRRADRAVSALIGVNDRPTVVVEDVAVYRADGAHRYLRELRRHLTKCADWTILARGVGGGNESVLLRHREYIDYADTYTNTYVMVARVGRVVVVVADTGWETASGHKSLVRHLSKVAVRRAAAANHR
jgi:hypothetical protein